MLGFNYDEEDNLYFAYWNSKTLNEICCHHVRPLLDKQEIKSECMPMMKAQTKPQPMFMKDLMLIEDPNTNMYMMYFKDFSYQMMRALPQALVLLRPIPGHDL